MGQMLSDEGDQDEAINCLIDALRWNSKNGYALLMMGNILAKFKNDISTAMKYYDQAVAANQADHIALSNIAYLFFKENQFEAAKKYANAAKKLSENYPNTDFILGLVAKHENDLQSAFYSMTQVLKNASNDSQLYDNAVQQVTEVANHILNQNKGKKSVDEYRLELEKRGGIPIEISEDNSIQTAAKIEFAERHNRNKHLVKYKSSYEAVEHLMMHEMTHLDFVLQARKAGTNKVFLSTEKNKLRFIKSIGSTIQKLYNKGIDDRAVMQFADGIFKGINLQAYNTPIDLFIEDFLYNSFPELRPYQFFSLLNLLNESIASLTNPKVLEVAPAEIVSKTKIFGLVNALQFQEFFGINLSPAFKPSDEERKLATTLYQDFTAIRTTRQPGQEFELVEKWAKSLGIDSYFELEDEAKFDAENEIDAFLRQIEQDPYGLDAPEDPKEVEEMEQFQKSQEAIGTNPAVIFFLSEALQYFKDKSHEQIKAIAFELAQVGMAGIDPNKKDYIVGSFAGKRFTGYQLLAYYYASWALALPEKVNLLGLPYEQEFEIARKV